MLLTAAVLMAISRFAVGKGKLINHELRDAEKYLFAEDCYVYNSYYVGSDGSTQMAKSADQCASICRRLATCK